MEVDINSRLTLQENSSEEINTTEHEDEEPFDVDRIVKKQFNAKMGQF